MPYIRIHNDTLVKRYNHVNPLKLRVIRNDGIQVTPDVDIVVSDLQKGNDGIKYKKFLRTGDGGITFKIKVIIGKKDKWNERLYNNTKLKYDIDQPYVTSILKKWYRNAAVLKVVTDFIDIKPGLYVMTKNPSRVQTFDKTTVWELEFTTYKPLITRKFKNDNRWVKKAIKSAKAKKVSAKKKSCKQSTTTKSKFKKCSLNNLKYSKNKKVVDCVKYLQKILKKLKVYDGKIDGWYGSMTVSAVKKFQKKYKKKYKLKETGKIDKSTFNALLKV